MHHCRYGVKHSVVILFGTIYQKNFSRYFRGLYVFLLYVFILSIVVFTMNYGKIVNFFCSSFAAFS